MRSGRSPVREPLPSPVHECPSPERAAPGEGRIGAFLREQRNIWNTIKYHALHPRGSLKHDAQEEAEKAGSRITMVGAGVNVFLAIFKAFAGVYGNSSAMKADAAHSFSDLISDVLAMLDVYAYAEDELRGVIPASKQPAAEPTSTSQPEAAAGVAAAGVDAAGVDAATTGDDSEGA